MAPSSSSRGARNPKQFAWDLIGPGFWDAGNAGARPSDAEAALLVDGMAAGDRCMVIGASTKGVIEAAIARKARVVVLDFSRGMLDALSGVLGEDSCHFVHADVLQAPRRTLVGRFDFVLADRLINRFVWSDLPAFVRSALAFLRVGGQLRTTVRIGLEPVDRALLDVSRSLGTSGDFFDESSSTIDFSKAARELEASAPEIPDLPRALQMQALAARGRESRYSEEQISTYLTAPGPSASRLRIVSTSWCPDTTQTKLYIAEKIER